MSRFTLPSYETVVIISGWLVAWVLLSGRRGWTSTAPGVETPSISVIIPARNEAHNITRLLDSLAAQTLVPEEVIVVDDESRDATATAVREFASVTLHESDPRPEGWTGKSWACWQGAVRAKGRLLVFIDADVTIAPSTLADAASEVGRRGGLVSVQPRHDVGSPIEALSLPFNVVAVMGLGVASAFRPRRERAGAGPFMACDRDAYEQIGGHRSVKGEIVEDLALARRFAAHDLSVTCLAGIDDVRYRMYPGGIRDLTNGWVKNFATGARFTAVSRVAAIGLWIAASLLAAWTAAVQVVSGDALVAALLYAAFTAQYAVLGRRVGRFGPAAAVWPALVAFFVGVFTWSLIAIYMLRRVRWSGRTLSVSRSQPPAT